MSEKKLRTFQELHHDIDKAFENDEYKLLINQKPPEKWLKPQPIGNGKYMPIDKTEFLLDSIFQDWQVEVLREGVMFQSVYVTIRLHYLHPVSGKWMFHDGVGAKSIQVNKGESAADLQHIKDGAVMMALPSAKSFAIKDAADHLGKLFGRDVNRKDTIAYQSAYDSSKKPEDKSDERILLLINNAKSKQSLETLFKDCTTPESLEAYDEKLKTF